MYLRALSTNSLILETFCDFQVALDYTQMHYPDAYPVIEKLGLPTTLTPVLIFSSQMDVRRSGDLVAIVVATSASKRLERRELRQVMSTMTGTCVDFNGLFSHGLIISGHIKRFCVADDGSLAGKAEDEPFGDLKAGYVP